MVMVSTGMALHPSTPTQGESCRMHINTLVLLERLLNRLQQDLSFFELLWNWVLLDRQRYAPRNSFKRPVGLL